MLVLCGRSTSRTSSPTGTRGSRRTIRSRSAPRSERLEQRGPALGRPLVGQVDGSKIHNLKELRPLGKTIRVLFVFDPRREAILLLGADKAEHGWKAWYPAAIAAAERLYADYVNDLRKEGLIE